MKFVELIEQIEFMEAAKDKYLPMLNVFDQIPDRNNDRELDGQIANIKRSAKEHARWAIQTLRNSDRIIWYIRLIRITFLTGIHEALRKSLSAHQSAGGWGDLDPEHAEQVEQNVRALQALDVTLARLIQKDERNLRSKAIAENQKVAQEAEANHERTNAKFRELESKCARQPDHSDCGLNKERLEAKVDELYAIVNFANQYSEFVIPTYAELTRIQNQLSHFESINYQPMNDFRFGWLPTGFVLSMLATLENTWQKLQSKILVHDVEPGGDYEGIEKVLDFDDGMAWWNLHRKYCEREGTAMGHCGNNYANAKESDEVISLREYVDTGEAGEQWIPHVTGVFDTANGMLGEMKGRSNNKPEAKYHKYILPLLKQDWVKGILMRPHQHEKYKNFYVSDLPEDIARALVEQKPDLATWKDRQVLGLEGDMSEMELDKINEQLDEWDVENIEAQRDDVFVLTSYSNKEQAYEAWSGQSWPEENWVDNPESEDYEAIYRRLGEDKDTARLMKEYMYLSDIDGHNKAYEVKPGDELSLETVDYSEMLDAYHEEESEFPLEDFVDEKWKAYHALGMQGDAEYEVENVQEYGLTEYEFGIEDQEGGGIDITMSMDYFFSEVMPNLEKKSEGYGSTTWESILELRVGDAHERYWENWHYGGADREEMLDNFVEWGLQYTRDEDPQETIDSMLQKAIEEKKKSLDYEIRQLKKDQMSLPLDDPEQPDPSAYRGAPPRERLADPWYKDWIDRLERERRR